jgi:hypothetical protein
MFVQGELGCAIGVGRTRKVFADGTQLLPCFEPLWIQAMIAVLSEVGPGLYHYGSDWSLEPCRAATIGQIPGVNLNRVQPIGVLRV